MRNILFTIWLVSFAYCMWRVVKRYKKSSHDGVIGISINLEIVPILLFAPILALADITVTWVFMIIDYHKKKKNIRHTTNRSKEE